MSTRTADVNPCDRYDTSYAWVDPNGDIIPLQNKQTHVAFAWQRAHPGEKFSRSKHWDEGMGFADALVDDGWLRVSNSYTWEFAVSRVSQKAFDVGVGLLFGCVAKSSWDIEKQIMWVDAGHGTEKLPVPAFLAKYGTPEQEAYLFERVLTRRASGRPSPARVAARWLAGRR